MEAKTSTPEVWGNTTHPLRFSDHIALLSGGMVVYLLIISPLLNVKQSRKEGSRIERRKGNRGGGRERLD